MDSDTTATADAVTTDTPPAADTPDLTPPAELELPPIDDATIGGVPAFTPPAPAPEAEEEKSKIPPGVSEPSFVHPSTDAQIVEPASVVRARHTERLKALVKMIELALPGNSSVAAIAAFVGGDKAAVKTRADFAAHLAAIENAIPSMDRWKIQEVNAILREFENDND